MCCRVGLAFLSRGLPLVIALLFRNRVDWWCFGAAGSCSFTNCPTGAAGSACVSCCVICFSSYVCVEVLPSGFAPEDWCILNSSARLTPLLKCSLSKLTFCCKGVEECLQLGGVVHAIPGEGVVAEDGLRGVG